MKLNHPMCNNRPPPPRLELAACRALFIAGAPIALLLCGLLVLLLYLRDMICATGSWLLGGAFWPNDTGMEGFRWACQAWETWSHLKKGWPR